jgi:hypothetical protein
MRIGVHRVAMMGPMLRGQSGRSSESEDSKTDKNAFGHSWPPEIIHPKPQTQNNSRALRFRKHPAMERVMESLS